jgi:hypothetical protein
MPGLRFTMWPLYSVTKHPWVRVSPGEIGVVISQLGPALPIGAKSAEYTSVFANFTDLDTFLREGGQKGVQCPVLPARHTKGSHPHGGGSLHVNVTCSQVDRGGGGGN